jgi:hypothetical protein
MNHMTTILTNVAGIYLDLYCIAHDLQRPLTPEQVKDAGVLFHDTFATLETARLIARERWQATKIHHIGFEDRMRKHVQHFVESYIGEPQTTPLGQQEVLDIIGYFEELVWKSYQVRFNDDADEA